MKVARMSDLRSGKTQSCGCRAKELTAERSTTHGMTNTPEYRAWANMITRCTNPNFAGWHRYGGRGIECRFSGFEQFLAALGHRPSPGHSVDRIDTNGHYEAGNVRWALRKSQNRNQSSNRLLTHDGRTQCVAAWAEEIGMHVKTLRHRLALGWSVERALTTPVSGRLPSSPS
jgi:hypothetical protein